jgi:methionyl-tRNA formyltransferase
MRLVYFGSGTFGLPTLEKLGRVHDVALVVSQPDRPAGRNLQPAPTPVARYAADHGLSIHKPADVNDPASLERIRAAEPAAFVVVAFGQKLGPPLLELSYPINLHASLLPRYRGAAPINWAIINGETETGVTVIQMTGRVDAGAILGRRAARIDPMETAGELEARLSLLGPELVVETLDLFESGRLHPEPQDESRACRGPRLSKSDGTTGFARPAAEVQRRIHGLVPWPGCTVRLGGQPLRLERAAVLAGGELAGVPGSILADGTVACSPGRLKLLVVQPPGGRKMTLEAYLRGRAAPPGAVLEPA